MNLSTLRNIVARKIGLNNTDGGADQGLIDDWANQAVLDFLARTHCTVDVGSVSATSGTWHYNLDDDILALINIWREDSDGNALNMVRVTPAEIIDYRRVLDSAIADSAITTYYATSGENLLLLYPTPASDYVLNFLYVPKPQAVSDGAHDFAIETYGRIPAQHHKALEHYVCWRAAEYNEQAVSQNGLSYAKLYEESVREAIRSANRMAGTQQPQARFRRRRVLTSRRDIYPQP